MSYRTSVGAYVLASRLTDTTASEESRAFVLNHGPSSIRPETLFGARIVLDGLCQWAAIVEVLYDDLALIRVGRLASIHYMPYGIVVAFRESLVQLLKDAFREVPVPSAVSVVFHRRVSAAGRSKALAQLELMWPNASHVTDKTLISYLPEFHVDAVLLVSILVALYLGTINPNSDWQTAVSSWAASATKAPSKEVTLARLLAVAGPAANYHRGLAAASKTKLCELPQPRSDCDRTSWLSGKTIINYSKIIAVSLPTTATSIQQPELLETLCGSDEAFKMDRWFREALTNTRLIILPFHLKSHWSVACLFLKQRVKCHYNPMRGNDEGRHSTVFSAGQRLVDLLTRDGKLGDEGDGNWDYRIYTRGPHQVNSNDCGLFVLQAMELFTRFGETADGGIPDDPLDLWVAPQIDQVTGQMVDMRARTSHELSVGALLPRPPLRHRRQYVA